MKKQLLISLIVLLAHVGYAKEVLENVNLSVTENGFEPSIIKVKSGSHVILKVVRKTDMTCATKIVFKQKNIKSDLPLNKEVSIDLGVLKKGDVGFACGMDMITGNIVAE